MRNLKIRYRGDGPLSNAEEILSGRVEPTSDMLHSPDEGVRSALALIGYGLETLINDPSPRVRENVAVNFYGLDTLINDPDPKVADMAKRKIEQKRRGNS